MSLNLPGRREDKKKKKHIDTLTWGWIQTFSSDLYAILVNLNWAIRIFPVEGMGEKQTKINTITWGWIQT